MNRRDALRLLAAGATLPLTPHSLFAYRKARKLLLSEAVPRTLNSHQFATARTMAELILPKTDTPGATDVGTAEFIDLILTEWYSADQREIFLKGLSDVDARTRALFGKDFVDAAVEQQQEILVALGERMLEESEEQRNRGRRTRGRRSELDKSFYPMIRRLTLTAYYTSEVGATTELNFQIVPGSFEPCIPVTGGSATKEAS